MVFPVRAGGRVIRAFPVTAAGTDGRIDARKMNEMREASFMKKPPPRRVVDFDEI